MMNGIWYWYNVQCDRSVDLYSVSIQLLNYNVKLVNVTMSQCYNYNTIISYYINYTEIQYISISTLHTEYKVTDSIPMPMLTD